MLRSLYAADSGLRAHQTMLDVVGDNIANVNTTGYKASSAVFEDTLSQQIRAASAANGALAGTNPAQVGLGVRLAAISPSFSQGALQSTGRSTDLAIQGDGFFMVSGNEGQLFTRAGAFTLDASGELSTPDGYKVEGWTAKATGAVDTTGAPGPLRLPIGVTLPPLPTSTATMSGNLSSSSPVGATATATLNAYDAKGTQVPYTVTFTKTAADTWSAAVTDAAGTALGTTNVTFDSSGQLTSSPTAALTLTGGQAVSLDLKGLSGYATATTAAVTDQNGSAPGALLSFTVGNDGTITGVFTNGVKQSLGQVALATFANPAGLDQLDGTMWRSTVNSGDPLVGVAGSGSRGTLASGELEMSNVDLGQEFSSLIVAQRGFQANAKVVSASDQVLQQLVNMTQ